MKGDFSKLRYTPSLNFNGVLAQQGKVLLDSDVNAQTLIENNWHNTAARDVMGSVAAVPAAMPDAFAITAASLSGGVVTLTVGTGHVWADGLLVRLGSHPGNTVTRTATWLEPPLIPTAGSAGDVTNGGMDAVVLEVWQHAVNGFQIPDVLIEPALGGPDTAERLQTSFAFRLARLNAGQSCVGLAFDESGRGALTVSLVPPITTTGDCPVEASGGYSGFEHQLYRIEIADTNGSGTQFKWSRTNGGLVGRGNFDPATQKIAITANLAAIGSSNQAASYLEIEQWDPSLGFARVIAGAPATLGADGLQCAAAPTFGAYPASAGEIFFRQWDGILPISAYPISANPTALENGILLQFDADGPGKYFPGDYWMFPVRAQGIANPQVLVDAKQPQGIVYHRLPLAEITWSSAANGFTGTIEDCRSIVPPLSQNKGCCTCRVGDGVHSFGDFTSIQAAIDSLPADGGEVCILPGRYFEDVHIVNRRDIVIHGCGWQTRLASASLAPVQLEAQPAANAVNSFPAVITVVASQHIQMRSFAVEAADDAVGILLDGTRSTLQQTQLEQMARAAAAVQRVIDVQIENLVMVGATLPAILANTVELLRINANRVLMKNVRSTWPAIYVSGSEVHVEQNFVAVLTVDIARDYLPISVIKDLTSNVAAGANTLGTSAGMTRSFFDATAAAYISVALAIHPGGIQVGGPSRDVYILGNKIEGGSRNGITLGSFMIVDANGNDSGKWVGLTFTAEGDDCCPGSLQPPGNPPGNGGGTIVAGGLLVNIHIHRNRIRNMGLCGIGPVGFFNLLQTLEVITILGLHITHNGITRTVLRDFLASDGKTTSLFGYGAVCIPDVQNLVVCDNSVIDFGSAPGVGACGIFVLHGEQLEISRNQVLETRDWNGSSALENIAAGAHGGIVILLATPPSFPQSLDSALWNGKDPLVNAAGAFVAPVYEPGLPAARVEHNVVRVALNYALELIGLGPFTIANNHLACGGLVSSAVTALAQTVLIGNFGTAIDGVLKFALPSNTFKNSRQPYADPLASRRESPGCGSVLFTGNECQLETTANGQREYTSVMIFTSDHLTFANNHCCVDGLRSAGLLDALLVAFSLNVTCNRFQESPTSVMLSGITAGTINITGENISTYCLIALGAMLSNNNNLALIQSTNQELCASFGKELIALLGQ